jgi:hypothetical protein
MDVSELKRALQLWMQCDTWFTHNPADQERFYQCIQQAVREFGCQLLFYHLKTAMDELADELYPGMDKKFREERISEFATKAKQIVMYEICACMPR